MGIWRNIYIKAYDIGRLSEVYVTQNHKKNQVELDVKVMYKGLENQNLMVKQKKKLY
jgi:beta-mannosidase